MSSNYTRPRPSSHVADLLPSVAISAMQTIAHGLNLDRTVAFWMRELDPMRTFARAAKVIDIIDESHKVKTFVLDPGPRWPRHRAGQFVPVTAEIDGVRTTRCYSLSSAPTLATNQSGQAPTIALTIKRVDGGRMSSHFHDTIRVGDVMGLGVPTGDFVLEGTDSRALLLLSAGSGITPVMSILRDLAANDAVDDIVFVHAARSGGDVIFRDELQRLAQRHPGLKLHFFFDDSGQSGRLDPTTLRECVPDVVQRNTYMCGPAGWMDLLTPLWVEAGIEPRLHVEHFSAIPRASERSSGVHVVPSGAPRDDIVSRKRVTLTKTNHSLLASIQGPLLEDIEHSGVSPAFGCRIGICNTCVCRKRAGVVENTRTGVRSSEPDEEIKLCISRAVSDLELEL